MSEIGRIGIEQAQQATTERDMQDLARLARTPNPSGEGADEKAVQEQAVHFEAIFVKSMIDAMRKTVEESDLFGDPSSPARSIYRSMLDTEYARLMAENQSIGLAGLIANQFGVEAPSGVPQPSSGLLGDVTTFAIQPRLGRFSSPAAGEVSSPFGMRIDPFSGDWRAHEGMDIAMAEGSSVRAAGDGQVVFAGEREGYGQVVIVDHGHGFNSLYGHLQSSTVKAGDAVRRGQEIARSGNSGRSTGPHLHFEIQIGGRPVDPGRFFKPGY